MLYRLALVVVFGVAAGCGQENGDAEEPVIREGWVSSDRLHRRTCAAATCGSVGLFFLRQKVAIYEEKNGWARVTKYYDASCEDGKSQYVDDGSSECSPENGIANGKFAEWISADHLSSTEPDDPGAGATGDHALVKGSDDYRIYSDMFAKAAADLISSGRCKRADFEEMGGFLKSTNHRNRPIYFTYCGSMTIENRIYLDAETGKTFK